MTAIMVLTIGVFIGLALGTIVHEAGHFACAAIGPMSIKLVSVGVGPVVLRGRLGKTDLVLRALPISGFAAPVTYDNIPKPWIALFLLGGVLGNCALIGLAAGIDHVSGPPILPQFIRDGFGPVVFLQVLSIISNLAPFRTIANGSSVGTDGLQIIELLCGRHVADTYPFYREMLRRYCVGTDPQPSAAWVRIGPQLFRSEVWTNEFARGDVLDAMQRELARGALRPEEEMWVLDHLITVGLASGDPEFRSHLDRWSLRACELGPEMTTLRGSRGAVLVELGQFEAGKALLEVVAASGDGNALDIVLTKIFLSRAERRLGNEAAAQRLLMEARKAADADSSLALGRSLAETTARMFGADAS